MIKELKQKNKELSLDVSMLQARIDRQNEHLKQHDTIRYDLQELRLLSENLGISGYEDVDDLLSLEGTLKRLRLNFRNGTFNFNLNQATLEADKLKLKLYESREHLEFKWQEVSLGFEVLQHSRKNINIIRHRYKINYSVYILYGLGHFHGWKVPVKTFRVFEEKVIHEVMRRDMNYLL